MVSRPNRTGISLLESLLAVAIMSISFAAIYGLSDLADRQAMMVRDQSLAIQICQSKMNEVISDVAPLAGQNGDCPTLPGWEWAVDEPQQHPDNKGLYVVTVRVYPAGGGNSGEEVVLQQVVLDPAYRGSALDKPGASEPEPTGAEQDPMAGGAMGTPMNPGMGQGGGQGGGRGGGQGGGRGGGQGGGAGGGPGGGQGGGNRR